MAQLTEGMVFAGKYRLVKRLSANKLTQVWKAIGPGIGSNHVAVKIFSTDKQIDPFVVSLLKEEFATTIIRHQGIITAQKFDINENIPYLIFQYHENGSLRDYISRKGKKTLFSEAQLVKLLAQIASALSYLHKSNFVHQDVTPSNILINSDGQYLLTDFGITRILHNSLSHTVGPNRIFHVDYASPDRYQTRSANPSDDIFSLGVIIHELAMGELPWPSDGGKSLLELDASTPYLEEKFSDEFIEIVHTCLHKEAEKRPTAMEVEKWAQEFTPKSIEQINQERSRKQSLAKEEIEQKKLRDEETIARVEAEKKARESALRRVQEALEAKGRGGKSSGRTVKHSETEIEQRLAYGETERKVREETERKVREETERKVREETERKAREETERKAREEAERKLREESKLLRKEQELLRAELEAERAAREAVERNARTEAERKARGEAEQKVLAETEQLRAEKERITKEQAALKAQLEAERLAREEAEQIAAAELVRRDKEAQENKNREQIQQTKNEQKRHEEELQAKREVKERLERETKLRDEIEKSFRQQYETELAKVAKNQHAKESERKAREIEEREKLERKIRDEIEQQAAKEFESKLTEAKELFEKEVANRKQRDEETRKQLEEEAKQERKALQQKLRKELQLEARAEIEAQLHALNEKVAQETAEWKVKEVEERKLRIELETKLRNEAERRTKEEFTRRAKEEEERARYEAGLKRIETESLQKAAREAERIARETLTQLAETKKRKKSLRKEERKKKQKQQSEFRQQSQKNEQQEFERRTLGVAAKQTREDVECETREVAERRFLEEGDLKAQVQVEREIREAIEQEQHILENSNRMSESSAGRTNNGDDRPNDFTTDVAVAIAGEELELTTSGQTKDNSTEFTEDFSLEKILEEYQSSVHIAVEPRTESCLQNGGSNPRRSDNLNKYIDQNGGRAAVSNSLVEAEEPDANKTTEVPTTILDTNSVQRALKIFMAFLTMGAIGFYFFGPSGSKSKEIELLRFKGTSVMCQSLLPELSKRYIERIGAKNIYTHSIPGGGLKIIGVFPGDTIKSITIESTDVTRVFSSLKEGSTDFGITQRLVRNSEAEAMLSLGNLQTRKSENVIALNAVRLVVHPGNPVSSITTSQVESILLGKISDWAEIGSGKGPIALYSVGDIDRLNEALTDALPATFALTTTVTNCESTEQLALKVHNDKQALGFVSAEPRAGVKTLKVRFGTGNAFLPTPTTICMEEYPFTVRYYVYNAEENENSFVAGFVRFALSDEGQGVVEKNGYISQKIELSGKFMLSHAPMEYKELAQRADRVAVNLRLRLESTELDSRSARDIERISSMVSSEIKKARSIILVGFSNNMGDASAEELVARKLLEKVEKEFSMHGIKVKASLVLRSIIPIADDNDPRGREKNRRVEVWLQ